jgi:hypothetical protein
MSVVQKVEMLAVMLAVLKVGSMVAHLVDLKVE